MSSITGQAAASCISIGGNPAALGVEIVYSPNIDQRAGAEVYHLAAAAAVTELGGAERSCIMNVERSLWGRRPYGCLVGV